MSGSPPFVLLVLLAAAALFVVKGLLLVTDPEEIGGELRYLIGVLDKSGGMAQSKPAKTGPETANITNEKSHSCSGGHLGWRTLRINNLQELVVSPRGTEGLQVAIDWWFPAEGSLPVA